MDFEFAERRFKSDQSKLRSRRGRNNGSSTTKRRNNNNNNSFRISEKAKREAAEQRVQYQKRKFERECQMKALDVGVSFMKKCDRDLGLIRSLGGGFEGEEKGGVSTNSSNNKVLPTYGNERGLMLRPTSIHGYGDKIALPPSVLESLANRENAGGMGGGQPMTFRIGILSPEYEFPASKRMKEMVESAKKAALTEGEGEDDDVLMDIDDEDDEEEDDMKKSEVYLEELKERYISYTHGTVVEFTQDEGNVGLPKGIAEALLSNSKKDKDLVPSMRTSDPASSKDTPMDDSDKKMPPEGVADDDEEKTSGHLAYGAFDIPDCEVEVVMLKLPKGKRCTLQPTEDAVRNGFYSLKDVKLVLEQSLIRTRATLSLNDTVHTWHRGKKFDLRVTSVSPARYDAVSCINTDIEVDFASPDSSENHAEHKEVNEVTSIGGDTLGGGEMSSSSDSKPPKSMPLGGRRLDDSANHKKNSPINTNSPSPEHQRTATTNTPTLLPPEPPSNKKEGVCTIQIRGPDGATGRRRFDVSISTLHHLFQFAASVCSLDGEFRLVTRFPRRVFEKEEGNLGATLESVGIVPGQEMLMVERS